MRRNNPEGSRLRPSWAESQISHIAQLIGTVRAISIAYFWLTLASAGFCQTGATYFDAPKQDAAAAPVSPDKFGQGHFRTESIRGRVVWLAEALKTQFGISTVPEAAERALAIQTVDGALLPIVEDIRGHSFRTDVRLREMSVELFVRRYQQHPMLQILRIYELKDGKRYEVDYWCDICAIVMFETGPCACCQDDNRLRKRLVE